jgi:sugar lactone lactonase YvrE
MDRVGAKRLGSIAGHALLVTLLVNAVMGCSSGARSSGSKDGGTGGGSAGIGAGGSTGRGGSGGRDAGGNGSSGGGGSGGASADAEIDLPPADGAAPDADGGTDTGGFACAPSVPEPPPAPDSVTYLPNVVVATLAGGGAPGTTDGTAAVASFSNPVSVIVEPAGTLIVCDFDSSLLRRVDAAGTVTTLASAAGFLRPFGLGYGADGALYVDTDYNPSGIKDTTTGTIWRVDPVSGPPSVVAANVGRPRGFGALPDGRLLLADYENARLRLLDPATGAVADLAGDPACPGMADGQGRDARLDGPYAVAPLGDGSFVVADYHNHRLRRVTTEGAVSVYAGDGGSGTIDGPRLAARFAGPESLVADHAGNVYVADSVAHTIRRVGADGTVVTVAGDGTAGFRDGAGAQAEFYGEEGIAISADGMTLFVADGTGGEPDPYNRIRRVTLGP